MFNNGRDAIDIGHEEGYVSFNNLEVACLEMRGRCTLTSFPPSRHPIGPTPRAVKTNT